MLQWAGAGYVGIRAIHTISSNDSRRFCSELDRLAGFVGLHGIGGPASPRSAYCTLTVADNPAYITLSCFFTADALPEYSV